MPVTAPVKMHCCHCGEDCNTTIRFNDKYFCCDGCKMVYGLLNDAGLCAYYDFNNVPGISLKKETRKDKFSFLDDDKIVAQLISFRDQGQTHITLYLPHIHCSSCLYLLENLHKLEPAVISSTVNFPQKEITIVFSNKTSLRHVAELLTSIGYEPYLSLNNIKQAKPRVSKHMIYRLGIAGFCFGNIMMLSFPEYLGLGGDEGDLRIMFRAFIFILCLPVILYSAQPFYQSAIGGLKHKYLNIDAPIVLAIIVTFGRSLYEIFSGTGPGYFDSLTGIIFFMLAGRILQDKTYGKLTFDRDYTSFFPVAVTLVKNNIQTPVMLPEIKPGDTLLIHNEELVPADGILTKGKAWIDYSFVTGESAPVLKEMGEIVYAGGRQMAGNIEILALKEVAQGYLTSLWAKQETKADEKEQPSFVNLLSRYFTYIVFAIAIVTAFYWLKADAAKVWPAITAILIIACPCALLLSNTFTNGNILGILSRSQFYLRNARVIETIACTNYIVFDKTGTLTCANTQHVEYLGKKLTTVQQKAIAALAAQSNHPLSRAIARQMGNDGCFTVENFAEIPGFGIHGYVNNNYYRIGSRKFVANATGEDGNTGSFAFVSQNDGVMGRFVFSNQYRNHIDVLIAKLGRYFPLLVLTGDNETEKQRLQKLTRKKATLLFNQKPDDKLEQIKKLQQQGYSVMMVGDGLNDGPSLKQADIGIAVADGNNNFTPACDAVINANRLQLLYKFIKLCRLNKKIVLASFVLSLLYNIIGLYFAVQGNLSPLIAAILMPCSSLSILLVTFGSSRLMARILKLSSVPA